jgi:hypothetical protein
VTEDTAITSETWQLEIVRKHDFAHSKKRGMILVLAFMHDCLAGNFMFCLLNR